MDLSGIPILDTHGHAFDPDKEISDFRTYFNQSLWLPPMDLVKSSLINYKMMIELRKILEIKSEIDQEEVVSTRNKIYKSDPKKYIKKLIGSVKVDGIMVDIGYPSKMFTGYDVDLNIFSDLMGCKIYPVYRLDLSVYKIFETLPSTFEEALNILVKDLDFAIKSENVVAIKSMIAYETGLGIQKNTKKEAQLAYDRFIINPNKWDEKILQDYFVITCMKKCKENDIAIQFHTGFGSPPLEKILKSNPILLEDILADDEIKETKVIILHSGLPYSAEAGYLTSVFPNCYCDLSGILVNFGLAFKKAFIDVFEYGSSSRITFGTDGIMVPETYWMSYTQGLKLLGEALEELVSYNWITRKDAFEIAENILNANARKIFNI